jgi:hypothetical protein
VRSEGRTRRRPPADWDRKQKSETGQKVKLFGRHDRFSPFGDDGVSLAHGHTGIFGEHDGATTTSPCHKINEMFFAEGSGPAGCVRQIRAAFN